MINPLLKRLARLSFQQIDIKLKDRLRELKSLVNALRKFEVYFIGNQDIKTLPNGLRNSYHVALSRPYFDKLKEYNSLSKEIAKHQAREHVLITAIEALESDIKSTVATLERPMLLGNPAQLSVDGKRNLRKKISTMTSLLNKKKFEHDGVTMDLNSLSEAFRLASNDKDRLRANLGTDFKSSLTQLTDELNNLKLRISAGETVAFRERKMSRISFDDGIKRKRLPLSNEAAKRQLKKIEEMIKTATGEKRQRLGGRITRLKQQLGMPLGRPKKIANQVFGRPTNRERELLRKIFLSDEKNSAVMSQSFARSPSDPNKKLTTISKEIQSLNEVILEGQAERDRLYSAIQKAERYLRVQFIKASKENRPILKALILAAEKKSNPSAILSLAGRPEISKAGVGDAARLLESNIPNLSAIEKDLEIYQKAIASRKKIEKSLRAKMKMGMPQSFAGNKCSGVKDPEERSKRGCPELGKGGAKEITKKDKKADSQVKKENQKLDKTAEYKKRLAIKNKIVDRNDKQIQEYYVKEKRIKNLEKNNSMAIREIKSLADSANANEKKVLDNAIKAFENKNINKLYSISKSNVLYGSGFDEMIHMMVENIDSINYEREQLSLLKDLINQDYEGIAYLTGRPKKTIMSDKRQVGLYQENSNKAKRNFSQKAPGIKLTPSLNISKYQNLTFAELSGFQRFLRKLTKSGRYQDQIDAVQDQMVANNSKIKQAEVELDFLKKDKLALAPVLRGEVLSRRLTTIGDLHSDARALVRSTAGDIKAGMDNKRKADIENDIRQEELRLGRKLLWDEKNKIISEHALVRIGQENILRNSITDKEAEKILDEALKKAFKRVQEFLGIGRILQEALNKLRNELAKAKKPRLGPRAKEAALNGQIKATWGKLIGEYGVAKTKMLAIKAKLKTLPDMQIHDREAIVTINKQIKQLEVQEKLKHRSYMPQLTQEQKMDVQRKIQASFDEIERIEKRINDRSARILDLSDEAKMLQVSVDRKKESITRLENRQNNPELRKQGALPPWLIQED